MTSAFSILNPGFHPATVFDADARAFLQAAGIVYGGIYYPDTPYEIGGSGLWSALNRLVKGLKDSGVWWKLGFWYPLIGGTAFSHKWNLRDPRDTNDAFRQEFVGSPLHAATGIDWNGTTQYALSHLTPAGVSTEETGVAMGYYSREDIIAPGEIDMGSNNTPSQSLLLVTKGTDGRPAARNAGSSMYGEAGPGYGHFMTSSFGTGTPAALYRDTVQLVSQPFEGLLPTNILTIGGLLIFDVLYGTTRECGTAWYAKQGLTPVELAAIEQLNREFQLALNRYVV
ncbi:hypothetical protein LGH70_19490 [Hymenobacter sp. BT635]|uniref:Uncharacterized protein n=1 Tax=Hymenobacter nitidus TaxID=2880929 RepID=A0ABS8AJU7_9BACT|nr:hypothetical protein [Hymenobacter nitidus]MCB2379789.1 hypothetical protein [Hymenobacter nitidus]